MTDQARKDFEAWFTMRMGSGLLSKNIAHEYEWDEPRMLWKAWQTATLAERERCAALAYNAGMDGLSISIRQGGAA